MRTMIKVQQLILMIILLLITKVSYSLSYEADISFNGDTVHFEVIGADQFDYQIKKVNKGEKSLVEVTIPPLTEKSIQKLKNFKSELVEKVSINKNAADGNYILIAETPGVEVETFDYLTDQPSRIIVDFFVSEKNKIKLLQKKNKNNKNFVKNSENEIMFDKVNESELDINSKNTSNQLGKKIEIVKDPLVDRKPATADYLKLTTEESKLQLKEPESLRAGVFDGGDINYDRFSIKEFEIKPEAILKSRENYYIPFPLLEVESRYWIKMQKTPNVYQIYPKDSIENKQARLLLKMFEQKKWATFLKTLEYFKQKYPITQYDEIFAFMSGDVYRELWKETQQSKYFDRANNEYLSALNKYPQSVVAEKVSLSIGYLNYDRGNHLEAIQHFNQHIEKYKKYPEAKLSVELAIIGKGLSFNKLSKPDDAKSIYNSLEKESKNLELQAEAAFRVGDVLLKSKKYQDSVDEYQNSLKKYTQFQMDYPSAYYNQAEALFNLKKYKQSLDVFNEFVKRFPNHEQLPYALTRVGELLDILGAPQEKVQGAYLETYFRYADNPKAIIARLHLLSQKMETMKEKDLENATEEIKTLASKVELPKIEQFVNVMITNGFTHRGDFEKSYKLLIDYYQKNPLAEDLDFIKKRIVSNIVKQIRHESNNNNFMSTFKIYNKFKDSWIKSTGRMDIPYFIGRSYEQGGNYNEAGLKFLDVINYMYSVKGTEKEKEDNVLQNLPSIDALNLRLAQVKFQKKDFVASFNYLKSINQPELLNEDEQIERIQLAVNLLKEKKDFDSAIRYLTDLLKTWRGEPEKVSGPYLSLANLELELGRTQDALNSLLKITSIMKDTDAVPVDIHAKALESIAQIYYNQKDLKNSEKYYTELLDKYEDQRPLGSIRYKLGQIFYRQGELKKASEAWSSFKGENSEFWKKMAAEQIKSAEWNQEYQKYQKRAPASNSTKKE